MAHREVGPRRKRPMEKAARGENGPAPFQVSQSHLEPPNLIFRCFGHEYASLSQNTNNAREARL